MTCAKSYSRTVRQGNLFLVSGPCHVMRTGRKKSRQRRTRGLAASAGRDAVHPLPVLQGERDAEACDVEFCIRAIHKKIGRHLKNHQGHHWVPDLFCSPPAGSPFQPFQPFPGRPHFPLAPASAGLDEVTIAGAPRSDRLVAILVFPQPERRGVDIRPALSYVVAQSGGSTYAHRRSGPYRRKNQAGGRRRTRRDRPHRVRCLPPDDGADRGRETPAVRALGAERGDRCGHGGRAAGATWSRSAMSTA